MFASVAEIYPLSFALGAAIGFSNLVIILLMKVDSGCLTAIVSSPATAKS